MESVVKDPHKDLQTIFFSSCYQKSSDPSAEVGANTQPPLAVDAGDKTLQIPKLQLSFTIFFRRIFLFCSAGENRGTKGAKVILWAAVPAQHRRGIVDRWCSPHSLLPHTSLLERRGLVWLHKTSCQCPYMFGFHVNVDWNRWEGCAFCPPAVRATKQRSDAVL